MRRPTAITATPYKSSYLAIPPSPFSPQFPITPPASPPLSKSTYGNPRQHSSAYNANIHGPPPPEPMRWLWQCHCCHHVYPLGATRRCLDDGHHFCAGTVTWKKGAKGGKARKVIKSCPSEFDYHGWKAWGGWRRSVVAEMVSEALFFDFDAALMSLPPSATMRRDSVQSWEESAPATPFPSAACGSEKDCWNSCDYPSNCRWGAQYGVQSPGQPQSTVVAGRRSAVTVVDQEVKALREEVLCVTKHGDEKGRESNGGRATTRLDPNLVTSAALAAQEGVSDIDTKQLTVEDVVESAVRRRRRSAGHIPSPLASNPVPSSSHDRCAEDTSLFAVQAVKSKVRLEKIEVTLFQDFARLGSQLVSGMRSTAR